MNVIIGLAIFGCCFALIALGRKLCRKIRAIFTMPEPAPDVRVTYYCTKRPPDVGMLPFYGHLFSVDYGERKYVSEIDRMAYGEAIYNRELTHEIMSTFGLIREPQE